MKKITLIAALLLGTYLTVYSQQKSTGMVTLSSNMKVMIDLDQGTSTATITMVGPSTKWFAIGLNTTSMSLNKDCISYGTSLLDRYMGSGHSQPITDSQNDLFLVSDSVNGTERTVIMTRPFNTGDSKDYAFNFALNTLNIIWAIGPSNNLSSQHSTFGSKQLSFTTLDTDNFNSFENIKIYPNPSNTVFTISKDISIEVSKIKLFDCTAKLLKEIQTNTADSSLFLDLTDFPKGVYFVELSNDFDKIIKKIIVN